MPHFLEVGKARRTFHVDAPCRRDWEHYPAPDGNYCLACGLLFMKPQIRRRRRSRTLNSRVVRVKIARLLDRDGSFCHWCEREFTGDLRPTLDHLVSWSRGGGNEDANLVLACKPCNEERGGTNKTLRRWNTKMRTLRHRCQNPRCPHSL